MARNGVKSGGGSRKGKLNKSTEELKAIFESCEVAGKIDWEKLFVVLYKRALRRGGDKAALIIAEYRFGKAPQSIDLTSKGEKLSLNIVYEKVSSLGE